MFFSVNDARGSRITNTGAEQELKAKQERPPSQAYGAATEREQEQEEPLLMGMQATRLPRQKVCLPFGAPVLIWRGEENRGHHQAL